MLRDENNEMLPLMMLLLFLLLDLSMLRGSEGISVVALP